MTDSEIIQDFFNALGIHGTLMWPVDVAQIVSGAGGLRDLGGNPDTEPRHILQCIDQLYRGASPAYFKHLIDHPADVDDLWVSYWCPQPPGVELHKADCPAGTTPLWSNGRQTVYGRVRYDKHGNEGYDFGIH